MAILFLLFPPPANPQCHPYSWPSPANHDSRRQRRHEEGEKWKSTLSQRYPGRSLETPWPAKYHNCIIMGGKVPEAWTNSITVTIWKASGDAINWANYRLIHFLCHTMKIFVRILDTHPGSLTINVGVPPGSALSPLLFIFCMDTKITDLQTPHPWSLLYADNVFLVNPTRTDLWHHMQQWKTCLADYGRRLNTRKTDYMDTQQDVDED